MSRKQRGAAAEGEQTGEERGWFDRLRAQPGFRTAFVAFCLTVILGVGAPAAYALWSSSVSGIITVQTVKPPLPVIAKPVCNRTPAPTTVSWTAPQAGLPAGAVYLVSVTKANNESYVYAQSNTEFVPSQDRDLARWTDGNPVSPTRTIVTVQVAELNAGITVPRRIDPSRDIIRKSESSPGIRLLSLSSAGVWPWYEC